MQRLSGSAGRPTYNPAGHAEKPDHRQPNPPDNMESRGSVDRSATERAEMNNPELELSSLPVCRQRWHASEPLATLGDSACSAIILESSNCVSENKDSSAARPAYHSSDIDSTLAADVFEECMITTAAQKFFQQSAAIIPEVIHEILLNLPPPCLLRLSVGSQALHRHATCDDVCMVAIYGSLLSDSLAVLSQALDGIWPDGQARLQEHVLGSLLMFVIGCYVLVIVLEKASINSYLNVWKHLVKAQWPGGRVLCQHNILGHSFLNAFRKHKVLLSVDPATQRGLLPTALALWLPDVKQQYWMFVELRYFDPNVDASEAPPPVTSALLSIESRLSSFIRGYPCLTSALKLEQKIRIPLEEEFDSDHLFFAVTIVRKRDAKCKRIFQFPSPSEAFFDVVDKAILFDCPSTLEITHRDPRISYLTRCESGLQVHLGIARGTDAHEAECVEIYSYSDTGYRPDATHKEGIRETLLRIEHVGIWF